MSDSLLHRIPPLVKNFGFGMFCLGATLALGVVLGSQSLGKAIATMKRGQSPIQVKGLAEMNVVADRATWTGTVASRAKTLAEAFTMLEAGTGSLRTLIVAQGFTPGEFAACEVDTSIIYGKTEKGESTNVIESYLLKQRTVVWSSRVAAVHELAFRATDLIKSGVEVDSGSASYSCSGLEAVKMDLLEKATANGYQRAQLLARGSKSGVGSLLSASQGVFQIVPQGSTDVSDYGFSDTTAINKTVKAIVSLSFAIDS